VNDNKKLTETETNYTVPQECMLLGYQFFVGGDGGGGPGGEVYSVIQFGQGHRPVLVHPQHSEDAAVMGNA